MRNDEVRQMRLEAAGQVVVASRLTGTQAARPQAPEFPVPLLTVMVSALPVLPLLEIVQRVKR